jgi:hypothetical protein
MKQKKKKPPNESGTNKNTSSPSYHRWERRGSMNKHKKPNLQALAAAVTVLMIVSQMGVKRK